MNLRTEKYLINRCSAIRECGTRNILVIKIGLPRIKKEEKKKRKKEEIQTVERPHTTRTVWGRERAQIFFDFRSPANFHSRMEDCVWVEYSFESDRMQNVEYHSFEKASVIPTFHDKEILYAGIKGSNERNPLWMHYACYVEHLEILLTL